MENVKCCGVNDIVVSGRLVEDGAGTPISASASLTSSRVAFVTPTGDPAIREEETDSGDGQNEFSFQVARVKFVEVQ